MSKLSKLECMKSVSKSAVTISGLAVLVLSSVPAHAQISGFGGDGTGWTLNYNNNYGTFTAPSVTADALNIINGFGTGSSAFYNTPQNISAFTASFVWQNTVASDGLSPADGFVFTLQNAGVNALGGAGSGLGYEGITPASGVAFNLFQGREVGLGYAPTTIGDDSYSYQSTGLVNLDSTDPMSVVIHYAGGVLGVSVTDLDTAAVYDTSFNVDLTLDAGGSTAYVGFTGGSGLGQSDQTISDFRYSSSVPDGGLTSALLAGSLGVLGLMRRRVGDKS
jgi:hypothetical protein